MSAASEQRIIRRRLREQLVTRAVERFQERLVDERAWSTGTSLDTVYVATASTLRCSIHDLTAPADLVAIYRAIERAADAARAEDLVTLRTRMARRRFAALEDEYRFGEQLSACEMAEHYGIPYADLFKERAA